VLFLLRPESRIRPEGAYPVRVIVGVPRRRPASVSVRWRTYKAVKSPLRGKRADCGDARHYPCEPHPSHKKKAVPLTSCRQHSACWLSGEALVRIPLEYRSGKYERRVPGRKRLVCSTSSEKSARTSQW